MMVEEFKADPGQVPAKANKLVSGIPKVSLACTPQRGMRKDDDE